MSKKNITTNEKTFFMSDLATIIYQVADFDVALEMIVDALGEYFKIPHLAIARYNEDEEKFMIIKSRNFDQELQNKLQFSLFTPINGFIIRKERPSAFKEIGNGLKIGNQAITLENEVQTLYFFPFRFHEQINAFLIVSTLPGEVAPGTDEIRTISAFVNLMAPVFHAFGAIKKRKNTLENIISKIIKDRIYEARLGLYPVSFAIFRIALHHEMMSTVILQDVVRTYQEIFSKRLGEQGDVIWLTLDTAFFIFPNADLFAAESLCAQLREDVNTAFTNQKDSVRVVVNFVTIGYPQSGEDAGEIIGQLWLRLFDELRPETLGV
jgi:hypothetical protein